MKKFSLNFFRLLAVTLFVLSISSNAKADTLATNAITTSAVIPSALTLEVTVEDQFSQAIVPSIDFGDLVRINDEFRAATFFKVYLKINSVGDACELYQVGTSLTRSGGAETIPDGAFIVKPQYEEAKNNSLSQPTGSQLGATSQVSGTRTLFTDPTGSNRIITAVYTLSGDPNVGATAIIPLSQKSGSYNGTVQFTLTTV